MQRLYSPYRVTESGLDFYAGTTFDFCDSIVDLDEFLCHHLFFLDTMGYPRSGFGTLAGGLVAGLRRQVHMYLAILLWLLFAATGKTCATCSPGLNIFL